MTSRRIPVLRLFSGLKSPWLVISGKDSIFT
jgi:hypothetical protein